MTASLIGLGALVLASATLFTLLKWIGAVYLVYLGLSLIRSAHTRGLTLPQTTDITARSVFGHATLVTALNPKSIAFFIAFVPQFIDATRPLAPQFVILISTFVTLAALNALAYALAADKLRRWVERPSIIAWLTRAGGATLIGMGVLTATLRRST
jgi:threonine/homoserine/homoserine lactone efflux protein